MNCRNTKESYSCFTKLLHSLLALFVSVEVLLGLFIGFIPGKILQGELFTFHKSLGVVLFFLSVVFIIWGWVINVRPAFPPTMKMWEKFSARFVQIILLWSVFIMSTSGWVMKTAHGSPPNFFWLFKLPMPFIPLSKTLAHNAYSIHIFFAWVVTIALCIHVLAALKHHFIDKDTILKRMFCSRSS
jgi:cytochrome b561